MSQLEPVLPPCGHTDRNTQLTELALMGANGDPMFFLVCTVPACPEYCRVFIDLRDPAMLGEDDPTDARNEQSKES